MFSEPDWNDTRNDAWGRLGMAGMGALRVALLFGSAAVALTLILTPIAQNRTHEMAMRSSAPRGLDHMSTGSVSRTGTYTIRRSVLQDSPARPCIIRGRAPRGGVC